MLDVAATMFLAHGYEGVSIDAVVARAGGTKTNVYTYFGNKARLFEAVVEQLCKELAARQPDLSGSAPAQALRAFGSAYLKAAADKRAIGLQRLVIAEAARFPGLGKHWLKLGPDAARTTVAAYLTGQGMREADARKLASHFLSLLGGELQRQLVTGSKAQSGQEIDAHVSDALALILQGTKLGKRK